MAGTSKQKNGPVAAVKTFVAGLELEGAEDVLGRVAIELAGALEEAPSYAKARLARELRECIAGLQQRAERWSTCVRDVRSGKGRSSEFRWRARRRLNFPRATASTSALRGPLDGRFCPCSLSRDDAVYSSGN